MEGTMIERAAAAFITVLLSASLFADEAKVVTLQEEILALAGERHAVTGDSLRIRREMLGIQKSIPGSQDKDGLRARMKEFHEALMRNRKKIQEITLKIREKRLELNASFKAMKRSKKPGQDEPKIEDVSNVE